MSESAATPGEEYTVITDPKALAVFEGEDLPIALRYVERPEDSLQHCLETGEDTIQPELFKAKMLDTTIGGTAGKAVLDSVASGRMVMLTKESAKALQENIPLAGKAVGVTKGIVRGTDGKFVKILEFSRGGTGIVRFAGSLGGVGTVFLAMEVKALNANINALRETITGQYEQTYINQLNGISDTLSDIYQTYWESGEIDQERLAGIVGDDQKVNELIREFERQLKAELEKMGKTPIEKYKYYLNNHDSLLNRLKHYELAHRIKMMTYLLRKIECTLNPDSKKEKLLSSLENSALEAWEKKNRTLEYVTTQLLLSEVIYEDTEPYKIQELVGKLTSVIGRYIGRNKVKVPRFVEAVEEFQLPPRYPAQISVESALIDEDTVQRITRRLRWKYFEEVPLIRGILPVVEGKKHSFLVIGKDDLLLLDGTIFFSEAEFDSCPLADIKYVGLTDDAKALDVFIGSQKLAFTVLQDEKVTANSVAAFIEVLNKSHADKQALESVLGESAVVSAEN